MRDQSQLVAFVVVVAVVALCHCTTAPPSDTTNVKDNEIAVDERFKPDPKIPKSMDPRFNKMIMPGQKPPMDVLVDSTTAAATKTRKPPTTKDETSTIAIMPLKDDKLVDDMLKDVSHADVGKTDHPIDDTDANYDEYYDEDHQDEFSDEDDEDIASDNNETKTAKADGNSKKADDDDTEDEYIDNDADETEGEIDSDDDEEEELQLDMNKVNNEMKQCPRDCICERNMHAYFVATCSRLDMETQSFANLLITDLQVIDIGPQFPIVLGVEFFKKIGLANVTSIKIANSSIEYISPSAFYGLNELYSVNLTNIGIDLIHPDTFMNNTKLKILTLSGNNLNVMQSLSSPYTDYMLKSPSIEELDISYCNMQEFLPTAFSQMKNIIYINLAGNKLVTLPLGLFDKADTIEELDLSNNRITSLPKDIFTKTPLGILHLKYNEISSNIEFITKDIQKLDLSYNKIKDVDSKMFKGMENLGSLVLKGNQIRKIHPAAFISLKGLLQIDLSFNDLDQLNSMTFHNNADLETIRINNNMRLKTLPAEGFESMSKSFKIFQFDASNCDLANLTENVFRTLPFIRKLNLSGNRIAVLPKNIFSPLAILIELDLSNNAISFLDQNIFWNNQDLSKLHLQSNSFESLSAKLFAPTIHLEELDVSDGDLVSLWHDSSPKKRVGEMLKNLKVLNASNNDLKGIYESDFATMRNLKVLDLKNNPLKCNDDFRNTMKFLGTREVSLGNRNSHHEIDPMNAANDHEEMSLAIEWNEFARKVCKRYEENKKIDQQVLDKIEETDDDYDDEETDDDNDADETPMDVEKLPVKPKEQENSTKKPISTTKAPKEKTSVKPKSTPSVPPTIVDTGNENGESQGDDDYDYNEDIDEEDREDESIREDETSDEKKKNVLLDGIKVITNVDSGIFGGSSRDDDDDDSEEVEEVLIRKASTNYRYLWPILIVMLSIVILLLVIMNVIAMCTRRRGELYRQALRQSSNSIIYQKLSEDISPQTPKVHRFVLVPETINTQTPKAHRYTPIQQV